jgi:hypothetical protein
MVGAQHTIRNLAADSGSIDGQLLYANYLIEGVGVNMDYGASIRTGEAVWQSTDSISES